MRGATHAAKKVKQVFSSLRSKLGKVQRPPTTDPITQIILGVFSRDLPESRAKEALEKLRSMVVDYNELRVIPPIELAEFIGDYPEARLKCEDISRALNKIFSIEHTLSFDRIVALPRKEMLDYINRVDGLEAYTRARIRLLGLEQHAFPLDEAMWAFARENELIDPKCTLEEAQQFIERQIEPEDALDCFALLRKQAWSDFGTAVKKREVERIQSVPPDRTSRNMLQLVMSGQAAGPMLDDDDDLPLEEFGEEESATEAPKSRKSTAKRETGRSKSEKPAASRKSGGAGRSAQKTRRAKDSKRSVGAR